MRIMITGARGMLGRTLTHSLASHDLSPVDIKDFDIADPLAVENAVASFQPETVIHCAAMTAVDQAETAPDSAYRINAIGSANLALACFKHQVRLIAFSTDYVFSGDLDRPYHEWDNPCPATVYGLSKLAGEEAIRQHCPNHLICRLAWLYGPGGPSFLHTMLRLAGKPTRVVNDQFGNPTSTLAVANYIPLLLDRPLAGTFHLTCEGEASWFDFALEISSLFKREPLPTPCGSNDFPRPAKRPANSRLEKKHLRLLSMPAMPDWRQALREFQAQYPEG
ncbi:MAG: dTDP-4-dehydrorhamnose reductase [Planctomycetota bacterium]|jgi:dTDP-4-dehydrorhamnose reductase|nr:dTDP-4-dehydrorhamnose reductase [Planctomycetota bacterium]